MHVIINSTKQKAFVNNVSKQVGTKVYTLSDLEGNEIWNGDRRTFDESQVTEIETTVLVAGEMALLEAMDKGIKNVIVP